MLRVGFELTIPACERVKTFYALDRATNVTGANMPKGLVRSQAWCNKYFDILASNKRDLDLSACAGCNLYE
jgi:hypothetical protein